MQDHLDIYISRTFQWYKELFNQMSFDSYNRLLKIRESIKISIPKVRAQLCVWIHFFRHSYTLKNMKYDSRASFLAHTFANLYFGREPKVRVATSFCTHFHRIMLAIIEYNLFFNYKAFWNFLTLVTNVQKQKENARLCMAKIQKKM